MRKTVDVSFYGKWFPLYILMHMEVHCTGFMYCKNFKKFFCTFCFTHCIMGKRTLTRHNNWFVVQMALKAATWTMFFPE